MYSGSLRTVHAGTMIRLWLFAVVLSTLVSRAAAFHFYGSETIKGLLGIWATFALIYIACVILSIVVLCLPHSSGHRTPFALLLTAATLLSIMAITGVVLTVLYNIDGDITWRAYVALEGMQTVALFCGLTLIFLAIAFVANDRYECAEEAYDGYSGGKKHPLRWWSFVWSFVIFGLGVSAGGLWTWQLMSAVSRGTRYDYFQIIVYTAGAVFTISGILAIAQAAVSYKRMNRAGVADRATRLLAFIIAPAYFCATASTFAFYLVTNIIQDWSSSDYDITVLIFWVIMNFFISSATLGLLILGMRGGDWYVSRLGSDTGKLAGNSPITTPKLDGHIANAFAQPQINYNPTVQPVYPAMSTPEDAQPQFGVESRPLSYFSAHSGSNVRPDTTYTYVGEVDSVLRGTAYGQALLQQQAPQRVQVSPPPHPGGSPQPIVPQPTGSSLQSGHTQATYPAEQPPISEQIRYRY